MSTIVLRLVKGVPLTNAELDANFSNLNTDKLEAGTTATLTNKTINLSSNTFVATSAQMATAVSDKTGSGALVFANSPTFVTPALGTPSSGTVTNLTGTASININGTVGATTATTGAFTTLTTSSTVTLNGGTANGVTYLNGSKVLTTGSSFVYDGSNLGVGNAPNAWGGAGATRRAIQNGAASFAETVVNSKSGAQIYANAFIDSNNDTKFILNGYATAYQQFDGTHTWLTSNASGTAGGTATMQGAMSLNPSGTLQITGGLSLTGTGKRITGDFSNATVANRVAFQSSTTNGDTAVGLIPNGTSTATRLGLHNGSDVANCSLLNLVCTSSAAVINSAIYGTGTYLPMTFFTGGSERVRIDTSGNVGIGTSSPTAPLTVKARAVDGIALRVLQSSAGSAAIQFTDDPVTVGWGGLTATSTYMLANSLGYMGFATNGSTERMRIDSSGNVGIGTSSPSGKLHVNGGSFDSLTVSGNSTNSVAARFQNSAASSRNWNLGSSGGGPSPAGTFFIYDDTAAAARMVIDSSGNVGIGTSSPQAKLAVSNAGAAGLEFFTNYPGGGVGTYIQSFNRSAVAYANTAYDAAMHVFFTSGTEKARIDSSGNLLVGTTLARSYVTISYGTSTGNGVTLVNTNTGNNQTKYNTINFVGTDTVGTGKDTGYIRSVPVDANYVASNLIFATRDADASAERMRIDNAGNMGIGSTNPSAKLMVLGASETTSAPTNAGTKASTVRIQGGFEGSGSGGALLFGAFGGFFAGIKGFITDGGSNTAGRLYFSTRRSTTDASLTSSMVLYENGSVEIYGSLSKGSGSFKIDHPLPEKTETHHLVHSFIEGPQADNIYRGRVWMVNGRAEVNIDTASGMTDGTFAALNRDVQCFTSNESDWDAVRGSVVGNVLTVECQNATSTALISWMVIGERQDKHMYDTDWTDENGKVIVEPTKSTTNF